MSALAYKLHVQTNQNELYSSTLHLCLTPCSLNIASHDVSPTAVEGTSSVYTLLYHRICGSCGVSLVVDLKAPVYMCLL